MHYHGNMMILIPLSTSLKKCGNGETKEVLGGQNFHLGCTKVLLSLI